MTSTGLYLFVEGFVCVWVPTGMASFWRWNGVQWRIQRGSFSAVAWLWSVWMILGQRWSQSRFWRWNTMKLCQLSEKEGSLWFNERAVRCPCEPVSGSQEDLQVSECGQGYGPIWQFVGCSCYKVINSMYRFLLILLHEEKKSGNIEF